MYTMEISSLIMLLYGSFIIFVFIMLALISKQLHEYIWPKIFKIRTKKVKYNKDINDPQSERINGNSDCYPNCSSDIWLRSCEDEIIEPLAGQVNGHIPCWLNGSLLRNGPGSWNVGNASFSHLFDCSALLHRFCIKNGRVTYQSRFIESETLKKNRTAQRIIVTEFGTASAPDPCHSIFDKISAIFRNDNNSSDNTMISIYPFGDEYYTFTEAPFMHRINPRTLETEGRICVTDFTGVINHTSHPHVLPNKSVYNLGMTTAFSGAVYNIICFPHGETMFEDAYVVGSIPSRWKVNPSYMHTFGITENYFIIVEQPLSVSVPHFLKAQFCNENLSACLKWFENKPTLFHLLDRRTGRLAYTFESETFFYLHIINQYEEDNHVIIDICCYKDPEMINCMYKDSILNMQSNPNYAALFRARPLRFVLPLGASSAGRKRLVKSVSFGGITNRIQQPKLRNSESQYEDITLMATNYKGDPHNNAKKKKIAERNSKYDSLNNLVSLRNTKATAYEMPDRNTFVRPEILCDIGCETPRIHYEKYLGKKYRYFYAISSDVDADNPGTLIKVDTYTKTFKTWCEADCYPSEPIFVPAPNAKSEDDGVVLASMVWSGLDENHVALLVLCAKSWTELGRCDFHTTGPVPKCLHGWFAKDII